MYRIGTNLDLTRNKDISVTSIIIILTLFVLSATKWGEGVNNSILEVIKTRPISQFYFPTFVLIGFVLPIIVKLYFLSNREVSRVIDPYLILFFWQIFGEIVLVIVYGNSLGLTTGFTFSLLRVIQIMKLIRVLCKNIFLRIFLITQCTIWTFNCLHIVLNRIIWIN